MSVPAACNPWIRICELLINMQIEDDIIMMRYFTVVVAPPLVESLTRLYHVFVCRWS